MSVPEVAVVMSLRRDIEAHDYKNTITNALFMHTSAAMYLRHRDNQGYLDNAVKVSFSSPNASLRSVIPN